MTTEWLLEMDRDGEVYTFGETVTEALLLQALDKIDGEHTYYCGLTHDRSGNHLMCFGTREVLIVEATLEGNGWKPQLVVLPRELDPCADVVGVRHASGNSGVLHVPRRETLMFGETRELFLEFLRSCAVPSPFQFVDKAYLSD